MNIKTEHDFFDTVFLKSDTAQLPRMVKSVQCLPGGVISYELEAANVSSWHYAGSISKEKIDFNGKAGFDASKVITKQPVMIRENASKA